MARGSSYEQALAEAQRLGYAEADPSDDVSGNDAAAKMAILARLAFGTPVHLDEVRYEGIEHLQADDLQYARELGLGLKLIGTAERLGEGLSVRVHPAFLYAGHPLASVNGPFNAVTVESEAITEITMSGPGAGGPSDRERRARRRRQRDVPAGQSAAAADAAGDRRGRRERLLRAHGGRRPPGRAGAVAHVLGEQGASIKSVVQRGLGENARLVMVTHPLARSRLREAVRVIAGSDFVRSAPRAIRVIEEEFV